MSTFSFETINVPNPAFPYVYISVNGVDASGVAVGNYSDADDDSDGFIASNGVGATFNPPNSSNTEVVGITAAGEIFGDYTDNLNKQYGFIDNAGVVTKISVFLANSTTVFGINSVGEIYGSYADSANDVLGFTDNNGDFATIAVSGAASTSVFGVNAAGEIVGSISDQNGKEHGFAINNGVTTIFDPPGSYSTSVVGVSAAGLIAGEYQDTSNFTHGFTYDNGVITTINIPGAVNVGVSQINDAGEIVGYYTDAAGNLDGFVDNNGAIATVDVPGAFYTDVLGVNDFGQIFGLYLASTGVEYGFVGVTGSAQPSGGTDFNKVANDFNGDGDTDVLWRNTSVGVVDWSMAGSTIASSGFLTSQGSVVDPDSSWSIVGTGDFNGDGKSDILWLNSSGSLADWTMSGSVISTSAYVTSQGQVVAPDGTWSIAGIGDFNGDGKSDILWRQGITETLVDWSMNGSQIASGNSLTYQGNAASMDASWNVAGIGDFNGDGEADILWRQSTTGSLVDWSMNGSQVASSATVTYQGSAVTPDASWSIVGVGDFNGDGKADVLWRQSTTGSLVEWLMNGSQISSSQVITSQGNAVTPDSTWAIAEIGDFNGDGKSDILWRQSSTGTLAEWQMNGSQIVSSQAPASQGNPISPDVSWQTQA